MFKITKLLKRTAAIAMAAAMLLCTAAMADSAASARKSSPEYHSADAIRERGVLTVSVSSNSTKFNYIIPDDPGQYGALAGTRDGVVPELCRRIAAGMGVELRFGEYESTAAQLQAAASGEVDIAADNFTISAERLALYEMTDSFHVGEIAGDRVFLSAEPKSGNRVQSETALARARIAVVKATAQATNTAIQYPQAELVELADNQAVLDALVSGEADAGVFSMINQEDVEKITQAMEQGTVVSSSYEVEIHDGYGFGLVLMKGNTELCRYLNRVIDHLRRSGWLHNCFKTEELESVERGVISHSDMLYQNLRFTAEDCPSLAFDDLDTDAWYHEYVDYAIENDLMNGTGAYAFSPYSTLTRAQAVTVLWRMENEPQVNYDMGFEDVADGQWYTEVIRWAVSEKIMEGHSDVAFGPNDPITREQLAVILYRYAAYKSYDVTAKGDPSSFTDASKISGWAYEAMEWACGTLMGGNGDGTINPTGNSRRCEFATMIMRFIEDVAVR